MEWVSYETTQLLLLQQLQFLYEIILLEIFWTFFLFLILKFLIFRAMYYSGKSMSFAKNWGLQLTHTKLPVPLYAWKVYLSLFLSHSQTLFKVYYSWYLTFKYVSQCVIDWCISSSITPATTWRQLGTSWPLCCLPSTLVLKLKWGAYLVIMSIKFATYLWNLLRSALVWFRFSFLKIILNP